MIYIDPDTQMCVFHTHRVTYYKHNELVIEYTNDSKTYWERYIDRWDHLSHLTWGGVSPTVEQTARLTQINAQVTPEDRLGHLVDLERYVEFNAILPSVTLTFLESQKTDTQVIEDTLTYLREVKRHTLAGYRWKQEIGGTQLPNGTQIYTDRESQASIGNTYNTLKNGLSGDVDWKSPSGWITVDLTLFEPIAQEAARHVRGAFKAERYVCEQIDQLNNLQQLWDFDVSQGFDLAYMQIRNQD